MSLEEAIALQPAWVGIWMYVLLLGAFIAPVGMLVWAQSRWVGVITLAASVIAAFAIQTMFDAMGYVKLLGLPHILWVPAVFLMLKKVRHPDMPVWPRRIMWFSIVVICISLAFDTVDVIRYVLGERAPLV